MSVTYIPSTASLVNILTNSSRTILFPPASEIPGRVITVKDVTGLANINSITLSTQGTDTLDGGANIYTITNPYDAITFVSRGANWLKTGGTGITTYQLTSTTTGIGTGGSGSITTTQLTSTTTGIEATIQVGGGITTTELTSTTTGIGATIQTGGGISGSDLISTTVGLGSSRYVSTSSLFVSLGSGPVQFPPINVPNILIQNWSTPISTIATFTSNTSNYYQNTVINISSILISTINGLGSSSYASTSLVYIPTIPAYTALPFPQIGIDPLSTVSTPYGTFSTLTAINTYLGATSIQTSINFYGLQGTYDGTVLAERLISTGTQEFLIFKGSSPGENIRLQASGSISFETGAYQSVYSSVITQSTPTILVTPARTVGVNCNAPAYTVDISGSLHTSGSATVDGQFNARARVIASTITTSQTLAPTDTGSLFFYITTTPLININLPTPAEAGSGWNVVIQNTPVSNQVITVQTPTLQPLSAGNTVKLYTDGLSWYFI